MKRHIDLPGKFLFLGTLAAFLALVCWQHAYTAPGRMLAVLAAKEQA